MAIKPPKWRHGAFVINQDGLYLAQDLTWEKVNRSRAFMHPTADLLQGGSWTDQARVVVPAQLDQTTGKVVTKGTPMTFTAFLRHRQET